MRYISNLTSPYALKYNGDDWDAVEKEDLVDQLFDDKGCKYNPDKNGKNVCMMGMPKEFFIPYPSLLPGCPIIFL